MLILYYNKIISPSAPIYIGQNSTWQVLPDSKMRFQTTAGHSKEVVKNLLSPFQQNFHLRVRKGCQNFLEDSCLHAVKPITISHGKKALLFSLTMRPHESLIFTKWHLDSHLKISPSESLAVCLCDGKGGRERTAVRTKALLPFSLTWMYNLLWAT